MLEERQDRDRREVGPGRIEHQPAKMPGGVADSGRPALSSAAMPQRASSATTRAARPRSGVTSAVRRPAVSSPRARCRQWRAPPRPRAPASTTVTPAKAATWPGRQGSRTCQASVVAAGRSASEHESGTVRLSGVTLPRAANVLPFRFQGLDQGLQCCLGMARAAFILADRGPPDGVELLVEPRQHHGAKIILGDRDDEIARRRDRAGRARDDDGSGNVPGRDPDCLGGKQAVAPLDGFEPAQPRQMAGQCEVAISRNCSVRSQYVSYCPPCACVSRPSASKGTLSICMPVDEMGEVARQPGRIAGRGRDQQRLRPRPE